MKDQGKSNNVGELGKREGKSAVCQQYQLSGQMKTEKRALDLATKMSLVLKQNCKSKGEIMSYLKEKVYFLFIRSKK